MTSILVHPATVKINVRNCREMVVAPAAIPAAVLDRLNIELRAILSEPETARFIADRGLIPVASPPPDELQRFVKSEIVRWGKVVEQAGAAGTQ